MTSAPGVPAYLTPEEVARVLRLSVGTLKDWRKQRADWGPVFVKIGANRVLYELSELKNWLAKRRIEPPEKRRKSPKRKRARRTESGRSDRR